MTEAAPIDLDVQSLQPPGLHDRITRRVGRWILRRLQKRVEREWREYEHKPKVSFGPLLPGRRARRGEPQVYRSFVQIHFHPRNPPPRNQQAAKGDE